MPKVYCKYCGMSFPDVRTLIINSCLYHPMGRQGMKHELYEGSEKTQYTCKYCGMTYRDLINLTRNNCQRHPGGFGKRHEPAL